MSTDEILNFFIEYKVWFIVGFSVIVLAIIGFIANKKKWLPGAKKNQLTEEETETLEFYDGKEVAQNDAGINNEAPVVGENLENFPDNDTNYEVENNIDNTNSNDMTSDNLNLYVTNNSLQEQENNMANDLPNNIDNDFSFEKNDFVDNSYDSSNDDVDINAEKEAQEIENELNESNVWLAHDDEIFENEVSSYNDEIKEDNVENSAPTETKVSEPVEPVYETTPVVPVYEEAPMITPLYDNNEEEKNEDVVHENIEAEPKLETEETVSEEKNNENDSLEETIENESINAAEKTDENIVSEENKIADNDLDFPDFELPKFEAPDPISFSTVDEDIDRLNDMNFSEDESIDIDSKPVSDKLEDTMQISYEQLKSMVDDIISENKLIKETDEIPDKKTEESTIAENDEKTSNVEENNATEEIEQQDDEDDVWKF